VDSDHRLAEPAICHLFGFSPERPRLHRQLKRIPNLGLALNMNIGEDEIHITEG
jgi:hypothetical protein